MSKDIQAHDPLTRLTPAERKFIHETVSTWSRKKVLDKLKRDLQTAVEIELATIPIYLYTYYSLRRTKDIDWNTVSRETRFANKAGAVIMSVAVEEMLHMSLSSNIYYSLFAEPPQLYRKSPRKFPTNLHYLGHSRVGPVGPDKKKVVSIPLAKFSFEQLWHFLQIEYPEPYNTTPVDSDWGTIGQFYSYLRCLLCAPQLTDADFQVGPVEHQIQSTNYSPNNVDTLSPEKNFNPWKFPDQAGSAAKVAEYQNAPDSHAGPAQLLTIDSRLDALEAIDTICDQGEGFGEKADADPSGHEKSHYYKFLKLQSELTEYKGTTEQLPKIPKQPKPAENPYSAEELDNVIVNFPDNPRTKDYRDPDFRALSDFSNGVYEYMLIMTETLFKVTPAYEQKGFFNQGMHKSMIWVMDKFIQVMRNLPLSDSAGCHFLAPTFENGALDVSRDKAFGKLCELGDEAILAAGRLQLKHPNVEAFQGLESNVRYYVNAALHDMSGGQSMHFPDVTRYWKH